MPRERRRAVGRVVDGGEVLVEIVLGRQGPQREFGRALDHGQQVIEVVRNAAREPAYRLELLRLEELPFHRPDPFFSLAPRGHVHVDADPLRNGAVRLQHRSGARRHPAVFPILPAKPKFGLVEPVVGHRLAPG